MMRDGHFVPSWRITSVRCCPSSSLSSQVFTCATNNSSSPPPSPLRHTADLVMLMLTSESQQVCNFPARNCLKMLHLRDFIPHTPQHFTFYHNKKLFKCLLNSTLNVKFKITFYWCSFERIIIFE